MKKMVFIIHGWDGHPKNCWFPWLKKELEKIGFQVEVPAMPNPSNPKINEWVGFLKEQVGKADKNTYFIGHSMGCRAIIGFLEKCKRKIGGAIFVAGWVALSNLENEEEKEIRRQWTTRKVDYEKVREKTKNFVAIFSDNDPYVPTEENVKTYKEKLNAKIIIEKGKGHFSDDDNVKELPIVLNELIRMIKEK